MNFYDEQIKRADREISKLNADIDKKKARIAEWKQVKKRCETEKQRDTAYSDTFMQILYDGKIKTDEQRSEILLHIKQYIAAMNDENFDEPFLEDFEKVDETENTAITENEENVQTENSVNYQNPLYTHNRS